MSPCEKVRTLIELSPSSIHCSVLHTVFAIARTLQDVHHPSVPTAPMVRRMSSIRPIAPFSVSCQVFRIHEMDQQQRLGNCGIVAYCAGPFAALILAHRLSSCHCVEERMVVATSPEVD